MRRLILALSLLPALASCVAHPGTDARAQVRAGMSARDLLRASGGFFSCQGSPQERPYPEVLLRVTPGGLFVRGFGQDDGTFQYANRDETASALESFMRKHPGTWKFSFGYAAVPRREYFDVTFDGNARVSAVSEIWYGGPR